MAESLIEKLDQAVEAMLAQGIASSRLTTSDDLLVQIAAELCGLPREEFKARLKDELRRTTSMEGAATRSVKPIREGFHTVTPYLSVREATKLIDFVKQAFGAEGVIHGVGSQGGIHAEYKIGDSIVMIGGGETARNTPMPTALHLYVDDVDAVYRRSLAAGATSLMEPIEDHGERVASIKDLAGNEWYIAKRLSGSHTDEGLRAVNVYLHPRGAAQMIEFLKQAFAAKEVVAYREHPEGPVVHAKIMIGDSVVEMGEAHGQWQPMPTMFFLYVDDVDAWYKRAVAGGATAMDEPTDQPYGDRVGAVSDPFGNTWYMATHIGG